MAGLGMKGRLLLIEASSEKWPSGSWVDLGDTRTYGLHGPPGPGPPMVDRAVESLHHSQPAPGLGNLRARSPGKIHEPIPFPEASQVRVVPA